MYFRLIGETHELLGELATDSAAHASDKPDALCQVLVQRWNALNQKKIY